MIATLRVAASVLRNPHAGYAIQLGMLLTPARKLGKQFVNPVPTSAGGFSVMIKVAPRFIFKGAAQSPKFPLGPFRTDPKIFASRPRSGLRITWMGHSTP